MYLQAADGEAPVVRIAYARRPVGRCAVAGSDIIGVAERTGEVVCCVSANDEG
jgi:hypothetical protein